MENNGFKYPFKSRSSPNSQHGEKSAVYAAELYGDMYKKHNPQKLLPHL